MKKTKHRLFIWVRVTLLLTTCLGNGQVNKAKKLTEAEYHLWSTLASEAITEQGKWVSYNLSYESGPDTLFVKNTKNLKSFAFPKGRAGKFLGEEYYACLIPEEGCKLLDLNTGKEQIFNKVKDFIFSKNKQYLVLFCAAEPDKTAIVIVEIKSGKKLQWDEVNTYTISPSGKAIALATLSGKETSVGIITMENQVTTLKFTQSQGNQFENLVWERSEEALVFVSRKQTAPPMTADQLLVYNLPKKQLYNYDTSTASAWPKDIELCANYTSAIGISNDGEQVFFRIKKKGASSLPTADEVQVWNTKDKDLYTFWSRYGSAEDLPKIMRWKPYSGELLTVVDDEQPQARLSGNQQYALVYDPEENKPSFKEEPDRDYYLKDISTGEKTPFLLQQPGTIGNLFCSPQGKYVVYIRDGQWWVYTRATNKHTAITKEGDESFADYQNNQTDVPQSYAEPQWTKNEGSVLLSDQFDVWEYTFSTGKFTRLTKGRETLWIYRMVNTKGDNPDSVVYKETALPSSDAILLQGNTFNHSESGYFIWHRAKPFQTLVSLPKYVHGLQIAATGETYSYIREDFNEPPSLVVVQEKSNAKTLYQSNPQHYKYNWGHTELIQYTNAKGTPLQGVLCYPFDYDPTKQYPMVVSVYEKQTVFLHRYLNPSLLSGASFNYCNYASNGYFVLLPDIEYELGNPGFSATDCVVKATLSAFNSAPIDKNRVGLCGYSFGGYETSFIITQTNMFAAAIAGGGIHDFINFALTEDASGKSSTARMEHFQMRMKKPFYEDYDGYLNNSPLYHVAKVNTPLLSFAGLKDNHVDFRQTTYLYQAMRRVGKEHIMLLYPNEHHVFQQNNHLEDITHKMSAWFGYYLKGEPRPAWFDPK